MFDLLDRPKVWIPVKWKSLRPDETDGVATTKAVENVVELFVEILDRPEIEELFVDDSGDILPEMDLEGFKRIASAWRGIVQGPEGNKTPVPFEDQYIEKFLAVPAVAGAVMQAYINGCAGKVETREGNSEASPGNGRPENRREKRAAKRT